MFAHRKTPKILAILKHVTQTVLHFANTGVHTSYFLYFSIKHTDTSEKKGNNFFDKKVLKINGKF